MGYVGIQHALRRDPFGVSQSHDFGVYGDGKAKFYYGNCPQESDAEARYLLRKDAHVFGYGTRDDRHDQNIGNYAEDCLDHEAKVEHVRHLGFGLLQGRDDNRDKVVAGLEGQSVEFQGALEVKVSLLQEHEKGGGEVSTVSQLVASSLPDPFEASG